MIGGPFIASCKDYLASPRTALDTPKPVRTIPAKAAPINPIDSSALASGSISKRVVFNVTPWKIAPINTIASEIARMTIAVIVNFFIFSHPLLIIDYTIFMRLIDLIYLFVINYIS